MSFEAFSSFLGDYGEMEEFVLQLQSGSGERFVTVYKAEYVENFVCYRTNEKSYTFTGPSASILTEKGEPIPYLDDGTAYIRLVQFTGNAATEFDLAMEQFKAELKKCGVDEEEFLCLAKKY